ncbi:MAG: hypothetical protein JO048_03875, partial [Methylobacteriaceae bacterium]|nr:hypothetical protein [Methylobacteriaceae bacterium]
MAARLLALALIVLALAGGAAPRAAEEDRGILADLISRLLSTPATRVSIGAVDGALSSDATIRDITIADRDGVWLRLDRARIEWRRLALLTRRLEVDRLEIGKLEIARKPLPAEGPVPGEDQPILPELPLKVIVRAFALGELSLGEPILGTAARVSASGAATLGPPSEGLDLTLEARRLDAAGTYTARLGFVPTPAGQQTSRLDLKLAVAEPAGGIVARAAAIPDLPPVRLDVSGTGPLDAYRAEVGFEAGPEIGANGFVTVSREGAARRLALDLEARVGGWLPEAVRPVLAGTTRLSGTAMIGDDGAVAILPPGIALDGALVRTEVTGGIGAGALADLRVTVASRANAASRTVVGGTEVGRLALQATIAGPIAGPRVEARLSAADLQVPQGRVRSVEGTFSARPQGSLVSAGTPIPLAADLRAAGLRLSDPAQARAVGDTLDLAFRGTTGPRAGI